MNFKDAHLAVYRTIVCAVRWAEPAALPSEFDFQIEISSFDFGRQSKREADANDVEKYFLSFKSPCVNHYLRSNGL